MAPAIGAVQVAFTNRLDLIAPVTGDPDFVPLVWSLKRRGLRVGVFGFEYEADRTEPERADKNAKLARALRHAANFCVNVSALEDQDPKSFEALFSQRGANATHLNESDPADAG